MLMAPLPGPDLRDQPAYAPVAAAAIASTQLGSIGLVGSLFSAGCPDRRLQPTLDAFHGLVQGSIELDALTFDERAASAAAEPWIAERISELFAGAVPCTIVHGDCHLGNVAADGDRAVLYDWTDACISHPFFDGVLLARSAGDEHHAAIKHAYTASWREGYPDSEVERTWELATFANRVFQAISYEGIYRAQEERSRWEMSGIVAKTLRQLGGEFAARRDA
jgi:aminoglycoside phosphotransferase (APT) family kinase protein